MLDLISESEQKPGNLKFFAPFIERTLIGGNLVKCPQRRIKSGLSRNEMWQQWILRSGDWY